MTTQRFSCLAVMVPLSLLATGCQSGGIFYQPKVKVNTLSAHDEVVLAAEFAQQAAPEQAATSQPQATTSQPAKKKGYTAPGT